MKSKTLKDSTHPIVLQVRFNKSTKRRKTGLSAPHTQFVGGVFTHLHSENKANNLLLSQWENAIQSLVVKTPDTVFGVLNGDSKDFEKLVHSIMDELLSQGRVATWQKNRDLLKSLKNYKYPTLSSIDYTYIKGYETHLLNGGCKNGGVKSYMRHLKVVVNEAIRRGLLDPKYYPFKNSMNPQGYSDKHLKSTHKARPVTSTALEIIKTTKGRSESIELARRVWLLSYYLCGMNLADLALLTPDDIQGKVVSVSRKKTSTPIQVPIGKKARKLLTAFENSEWYILPCYSLKHDTSEKRYHRLRYFNRKINDELKDFAKEHKIEKFTMYQARFTFATQLLHKGVPIAKISQLLAHRSILTTQNYLGKFAIGDMQDVSDLL